MGRNNSLNGHPGALKPMVEAFAAERSVVRSHQTYETAKSIAMSQLGFNVHDARCWHWVTGCSRITRRSKSGGTCRVPPPFLDLQACSLEEGGLRRVILTPTVDRRSIVLTMDRSFGAINVIGETLSRNDTRITPSRLLLG